MVKTDEEYRREVLQAWENYRATIIEISRMFPENPPPRDFEWEAEMDKWAEQTRKMLEGKQP